MRITGSMFGDDDIAQDDNSRGNEPPAFALPFQVVIQVGDAEQSRHACCKHDFAAMKSIWNRSARSSFQTLVREFRGDESGAVHCSIDCPKGPIRYLEFTKESPSCGWCSAIVTVSLFVGGNEILMVAHRARRIRQRVAAPGRGRVKNCSSGKSTGTLSIADLRVAYSNHDRPTTQKEQVSDDKVSISRHF